MNEVHVDHQTDKLTALPERNVVVNVVISSLSGNTYYVSSYLIRTQDGFRFSLELKSEKNSSEKSVKARAILNCDLSQSRNSLVSTFKSILKLN